MKATLKIGEILDLANGLAVAANAERTAQTLNAQRPADSFRPLDITAAFKYALAKNARIVKPVVDQYNAATADFQAARNAVFEAYAKANDGKPAVRTQAGQIVVAAEAAKDVAALIETHGIDDLLAQTETLDLHVVPLAAFPDCLNHVYDGIRLIVAEELADHQAALSSPEPLAGPANGENP